MNEVDKCPNILDGVCSMNLHKIGDLCKTKNGIEICVYNKVSDSIKYKTILADPPWKFNDSLDKTRTLPYKTLTIDKLARFPIRKISSESSHLYLWCPVALVDVGIELLKTWGFQYKTIIPWLKRTATGKIWFGMGHYFRNCYEFLLFGVRSNLRTITRNTRNHLDAIKPKRHHSGKPNDAYKLIEANSHAPYLELFATIPREGWTSWGWELQRHDIRLNFKSNVNKNMYGGDDIFSRKM